MTKLYALLKPDNFLQESYQKSLRVLREDGFGVLNYRILKVNSDLLAQMYIKDFSPNLDFYSFNNQLFDFAPAIALILEKDGMKQEDFCALKGSAIPEWIKDKNHLRYKMKAQTRIFNRIHIPQTTKQAYIESNIVFGDNREQVGGYKKLLIELKNSRYCKRLVSPHMLWCIIKYRIACMLQASDLLKNMLKERCLFRDETEIILWEIMAHTRTDIIERQIIRMIMKLNNQNLACSVYNLDYFWHCLELKRIFVSKIERYYLNGYFLYPTR